MCKDTNYQKLDMDTLNNEENKNKLFGKAKLNQDPLMNAVGINDINKLLERKEEQMKLSDFDKDICKSIIDYLDKWRDELNKNISVNNEQEQEQNENENNQYKDIIYQSQSNISVKSKIDLVTYHRNKFVKMWNKR